MASKESKEFINACAEVYKYLLKHGTPHTKIIITPEYVEMVSVEIGVPQKVLLEELQCSAQE